MLNSTLWCALHPGLCTKHVSCIDIVNPHNTGPVYLIPDLCSWQWMLTLLLFYRDSSWIGKRNPDKSGVAKRKEQESCVSLWQLWAWRSLPILLSVCLHLCISTLAIRNSASTHSTDCNAVKIWQAAYVMPWALLDFTCFMVRVHSVEDEEPGPPDSQESKKVHGPRNQGHHWLTR